MTFRMTQKEKPHELKGKPFCMTLAYPSAYDGQTGNGGSGSHRLRPYLPREPRVRKVSMFYKAISDSAEDDRF